MAVLNSTGPRNWKTASHTGWKCQLHLLLNEIPTWEGKILTAFLPWSRQELHVLHSMHCHRKAFTLTVSSGENFKQDGWPNKRGKKFMSKTIKNYFAMVLKKWCRKWQLLNTNYISDTRRCSQNLAIQCLIRIWHPHSVLLLY
jgi:GDP-D-mannose dehydratase